VPDAVETLGQEVHEEAKLGRLERILVGEDDGRASTEVRRLLEMAMRWV
jgi:hypothetical protein